MENNTQNDFKKYLNLDIKNINLLQLTYYLVIVIGLFFNMFKISALGITQSISGWEVVSGSGIWGIMLFLAILFGIATIFVKALNKFENTAFRVIPEFIVIFLILQWWGGNRKLKTVTFGGFMKLKLGFGFWIIMLVSIAVIIYKWWPIIRKSLNKNN